jgi:hypothetical protein
MDSLTATFGYLFDEIVYVRISATNQMGTGAWSMVNSNGALIRARPGKMVSVEKDPILTATSIKVLWTTLISNQETGNSQILSYNLWWDANSGTTNINLYEDFTSTIIVEGLVPGSGYQFKVRASNIYGYGEFSDVVTLIPDAVPDMMSTPTTSLVYPTVTITFTEPFNNGNAIIGYEIKIYSHTTASFIIDVAVCHGSLQVVIDALECEVPMSTLITDYGYQHGQLILTMVRAQNLVGWGSYSSQNSGGVITQTEPTFMNVAVLDYDAMRDTSIKVDWNSITSDQDTGAVAILSYSLEWDQASDNW